MVLGRAAASRLTGLARSLDLTYTRYADDLTFSGSARLRRGREGIEARVGEIARAEGFALNRAKLSHGSHRRNFLGGNWSLYPLRRLL